MSMKKITDFLMLLLMSVRQSQEIVPILVNQVKFLRQGPVEEELDLG